MPEGNNVIAVIPARGGSKGIPRKNIQIVGGKPLIAWSIEASINCPLIDRTILSTDDEEIAEVGLKLGAEVPFIRPTEFAVDHATTESALKHAVDWLEENEGYRTDILVFLQPTDIFRRQRWLHDESGKYSHLSWRGYGPRQSKSVILREDTGLACATRGSVIKAGNRIGDRVKIIEEDDYIPSIDIQYPFDLWLANKVIEEWGRMPNDDHGHAALDTSNGANNG